MFSKIDKAWVAALVSFIAMTSTQFFGFEISPAFQAAVISIVTGAMTWWVPNKT